MRTETTGGDRATGTQRLIAVLTGVVVAGAAAAIGCPGSRPGLTSPTGGGSLGLPTQPAVLVGAGDIADCGPGAEQTAKLLDTIPGTVFTVGDNAYLGGTATAFRECYHPTWGRHLSRTRPTPGNHEYEVPGATAYYDYFGERAGPRSLGYYRYELGSWQVFALNSEIAIGARSSQVEWLRNELARHPAPCVIAYWHRPRFASGKHGDGPDLDPIWRVLYEHGADVAITGHEHYYERHAPLDAEGRRDDGRGIRQFVAGTGGAPMFALSFTRPTAEAFAATQGVLVLNLLDGGYQWRFVSIEGATLDAGMGQCR